MDILPLHSPDSMVQLSVRGEVLNDGWSSGATQRNSSTTKALRFKRQTITEVAGMTTISTELSSELGIVLRHRVEHHAGEGGILVSTEIENIGKATLPIEMLSSFSICGVTPFAEDDAAGRLRLHRFRSVWSNEAKHEVNSLEELHLERTWVGTPVGQRFGQSGSMPIRGFHPFIALEDVKAGVFWGAQIAWHGSWQMEVYRRDDSVCISGGLGDY